MNETFLVKKAENPDAKRVAVIFSSLNANGFSFYKVAEQHAVDLHRIYVRDPYDHWYDSGISDSLSSWPAVSDCLKAALHELQPDDVVTMGASMGAYAALRFASDVNAGHCIAMSPQTLLDRRLPHTPKQPVSDASRDLGILLGNWRSQNATIFFGAEDFVDIYNVLRVQWQGANLLPIAGQDHLVAQHLTSHKVITTLLRDFAANGFFSAQARLTHKGIALNLNCFDHVQRSLINCVVEGHYLEAKCDTLAHLRALKELHLWADGLQIEAKILAHNKQFDDAIDVAAQACRLAPKSVTLSDAQADILLKAGRIDDAIEAYRRSLTIRAKHYGALCRLGELLWKTGHASEAVKMLKMAIEIRPRLQRAQMIADTLGIDLT